jgi:hypothetical protein
MMAQGATPACPAIDGFKFIVDASGVCVGKPDWVSIAYQTGRLDLVSVLLGIIAVLLVLAAFPAYRNIQAKCERIARGIGEKLKSDVGASVELLTIKELEARLPRLVESYLELARNAADNDDANRIARAQEDGGNGAQ